MKSVIVGTAGHIDHGKTALVKALTGIDADRLAEEKRRGITIDIGFAHLQLSAPNGEQVRFGFVDVPGHERFVRNMLAGVGGIDLVLLVIAADEGIKPQTREHFEICRLLGIKRGITVITKSDAVDSETLDVVRLEIEEFLRGSFLDVARAPVIPVSSLTGTGMDELKRALASAALEVQARDSEALTRLPIDRVFTMKGFGTVVTGTLVSGTITREQEMEVFPAGRRVRVRGVQVHGAIADRAVAGQRSALNLAGVPTEELHRGLVLAEPAVFRPTSRLDVLVSLLPSAKPLKHGARVHFHVYTDETVAEVRLFGARQIRPGEEAYASLRLVEATLLVPHDRFIIRQFSPLLTIGGGVVLDALPPHRKRQTDDVLNFLHVTRDSPLDKQLEARVSRTGSAGLSIADAVAEMNLRPNRISSLAKPAGLIFAGDVLLTPASFEAAKARLLKVVSDFHQANRLVPGVSKEELRERAMLGPALFTAALEKLTAAGKLQSSGEIVHLPGRGVAMKDEEAESKKIIEQAFASAGLKVPFLHEVLAGLKVDRARAQKLVTLLLRDKVLVKVSEELVFHQNTLSDLRKQVAALKAQTPKMDVARFKDMTGVSRKYAIPLLEYLDRERVTRRVGDERVIL